MKTILTAACGAVLFATSLPAIAAEPDLETRTIKIDYSNLDLTNARGVAKLEHRVSSAISQVCGGPSFNVQESLQQHSCEGAARNAASRDMQNAIGYARQLPKAGQTGAPAPAMVDRSISIPTLRSGPSLVRRH